METNTKLKTPRERIEIIQKYKQTGNEAFKVGDYKKAFQNYHFAIMYTKSVFEKPQTMIPVQSEKLNEEDLKEFKSLHAAITLNMALIHIKQENFDKALKECDQVLEIEKDNVKALYRRGLIHMNHRHDIDKARADFNKALSLEPNNDAIKKELKRLASEEKAQDDNLKAAYKKMFL
eukprot:TRINITY_DN13665_c0_g1_i1.p2 TRINITY_DN13665_c0_g1~~TRINITY_DN13665_c0_g1_i1.p2  ORF type:complete len:185 (-),score=46.26 TRINITY_DN13665_c0_g1_i1:618-1148(-)